VGDRAAAPPSRRVRVLQVIQNLNYGGMERVLADIVRHLDARRFEAHVLALEYLGKFSEGLEGVATIHLSPPMSRWSMVHPTRLIRQIRAIAPDAVHSHGGVWYKASLAARRAGVGRVIHTEHGRVLGESVTVRMADRLASRRTDIIVAVSEAAAASLRNGIVADPSHLVVVPNGIDTERFTGTGDREGCRAALGISPDDLVIGSIGRLEPIKGYDIMLRAYRALLEQWARPRPPVLVIAGDGSERSALERQSQAFPGGRVVFLGWRDDVHDLHAAFDFFTMSSRSEGMSISLLEAMAAGLCPVVTDVGGNRDVLGPDLAHLLVRSADAAALAGKWREVLLDGSARVRAASAAVRRVRESFDVRSMVSRYERIYRSGLLVPSQERTADCVPGGDHQSQTDE